MKFLRAGIYSSLLTLFLGIVGYFTYYSPWQVGRRVERGLALFFRDPPQVSGARKDWRGPLILDRIAVASAPVLDQRQFIALDDLEIESAGRNWGGLTWGRSGAPEAYRVRVRKADVSIDHEFVANPAGGITLESSWNFREIIRGWAWVPEAVHSGHFLEVDELSLVFQEIRRRQEKTSLSIEVEDLWIAPTPDANLEVRGDLRAGPHWSEGNFRLVIEPQKSGGVIITGQAAVDSLDGMDDWLAFLFPGHRLAKSILGIQGAASFSVNSLRLPLGGSPARGESGAAALPNAAGTGDTALPAGSGRDSFRAALRHYDSAVHLAPWNIGIRHVSGLMTLDPEGVLLEGLAGGLESGLSGELWGAEVQLGGRIGPSTAELELQLPETDLRNLAVSAQPPAIARLWRQLRPTGSLRGSLGFRWGAAGLFGWSGSGAFRDLSFGAEPFFGPSTGRFRIEQVASGWTGSVDLDASRFEPLGELTGRVSVQRVGEIWSLDFAGLRLGGGSVAGKLTVKDGCQGSLRWDGTTLRYAEEALMAESTSGKLDFDPNAETLSGRLTVQLSGVTLQRAALGADEALKDAPERIAFRSGELTAKVTEGGMDPVELVLRGEGHGMRLRGAIGERGALEGVAILALGDAGRALNLLPAAAQPPEWRKAVGDKGLPLRVRGDAARCRFRRLEWSDPAFMPPAAKGTPEGGGGPRTE